MWMLKGMEIEHLVGSMLVGCVVTFAAKGREMIATITLALVLCMLISTAFVWIAAHRGVDIAWMLSPWADPLMIVVGGAIVRTRRSAATTRLTGA